MFEALVSAIDELAAQPLTHVDGAQVVAFEQLLARVQAEHLRRVRAFADGGLWALDGSGTRGTRCVAQRRDGSTGAWQRQHLRVDPGEANRRARISRRLEGLPCWRDAFAAGRVSRAHLEILLAGTRHWPGQAVDEQQQLLLAAAIATNPMQLGARLRQLESQFLPEAAEERERTAFERRGLTLGRSAHGVTLLRGDLDTVGGALVESVLQAMSAPRTTDGERDPRTAAQRRHDALIEVFRIAADSTVVPSQQGRRPQVTVTVGLDTLRSAPDGTISSRSRPASPGQEPADLAWAGAISPCLALRLCCDAAVTRVVFDPTGIPIDVGRTTRVIPAGLRRALEVRDRGCVHPGCDRPVEWTEAHHRVHWAHGGPTTLANTCLVCDHHHDHWHRNHLRPERRPDGTWILIPYPRRT